MDTAAAKRRSALGRTAVALACAMSLSSATAAAATVDAGASETMGSSHYTGTKVFTRIKDGDYSVRPSYSQFHNDFSSGTYRVLSLRGAYDTKRYGAGLSLGGTPQVNGYSNFFFGFDGVLHLRPTKIGASAGVGQPPGYQNGSDDKGAIGLDLGMSLTEIVHRDQFETGSRRRPNGSVAIGETDFGVSAAVEALDNWLRLELTKSEYSSNLQAVEARSPRGAFLGGLDSAVQGFPDMVTALRYELEALPVVVPFASYTHTSFQQGQPAANAYGGGVSVEILSVVASASYERYVQPGLPNQNYYTLGASARF